jgi:hypothetical protein
MISPILIGGCCASAGAAASMTAASAPNPSKDFFSIAFLPVLCAGTRPLAFVLVVRSLATNARAVESYRGAAVG